MRREVIALFPLMGLSVAFLVNQSCATKTLLEEVEKEQEEPKKNLEEAKKNLEEAKKNLKEVRSLLEQAKEKIDKHKHDLVAHRAEEAKEEEEEEPEVTVTRGQEAEEMREEETGAPGVYEEEEEFGTVRVGWCDTLWDISARVYNNSLYWPAIYNLNRDSIGEDPWILSQGMELRYKLTLSEEEKEEAVRQAIEWDLKFKDRPRSPKCPPR